MKISTRARYGLRFVMELAANYGKRALYLKDIARSQDISEKYLSQIVIDLKAAHLIDAFRGAHGGYVLAKTPAEVSVYDIVAVLEGDLTLVDCARNPALCSRASHCISHEVWHKLGQVMIETLEAITLADLLERQKEKSREYAMYYI
jgi:Rrf2 family transcriptional regulator, cysteine metabolism repressor